MPTRANIVELLTQRMGDALTRDDLPRYSVEELASAVMTFASVTLNGIRERHPSETFDDQVRMHLLQMMPPVNTRPL